MNREEQQAVWKIVIDFLRRFGFEFENPEKIESNPIISTHLCVLGLPVGDKELIEFCFTAKAYNIYINIQDRIIFNKYSKEYENEDSTGDLEILTVGVFGNYGIVVFSPKGEKEKLFKAATERSKYLYKNLFGKHQEGCKYDPNRPHQLGFRYDPYSNRIIGGVTEKEANRTTKVSAELYKAWEKEFPNQEFPCERIVGYRELKVVPLYDYLDEYQYLIPIEEAFELPDLKETPKDSRKLFQVFSHHADPFSDNMRLSSTDRERCLRIIQRKQVTETIFCRKLFSLIFVAHRNLKGSFTDLSGSSLYPSNVGVTGMVYDLETFHSPIIFEEDIVMEEMQLEDLRLALEAFAIFCKLKSRDDTDELFIEGVKQAYSSYTKNRLSATVYNDIQEIVIKDIKGARKQGKITLSFENTSRAFFENQIW